MKRLRNEPERSNLPDLANTAQTNPQVNTGTGQNREGIPQMREGSPVQADADFNEWRLSHHLKYDTDLPAEPPASMYLEGEAISEPASTVVPEPRTEPERKSATQVETDAYLQALSKEERYKFEKLVPNNPSLLNLRNDRGETVLMIAEKKDNAFYIPTVRSLLDAEPDPIKKMALMEELKHHYSQMLGDAVRYEQTEMVGIALNQMPHPEIRMRSIAKTDKSGCNAVWRAVKNGNSVVTRMLLIAVPDPQRRMQLIAQKGEEGRTALLQAVIDNNKEIVNILLDVIPHTECRLQLILMEDNHGNLPLSRAADDGYKKIMRMLLNEAPDSDRRMRLIEQTDELGRNLLITVIRGNAPDFSEDLISHMIDPVRKVNLIAQSDNVGINALMYAIYEANPEDVDMLLRALPDQAMKEKWIFMATQADIRHMIKKDDEYEYEAGMREVLLDAMTSKQSQFALIEQMDMDGLRKLEYAVSYGNEDLVRMILDGAKNMQERVEMINFRDQEGETPFISAFLARKVSIARILLDAMPDWPSRVALINEAIDPANRLLGTHDVSTMRNFVEEHLRPWLY